MNQNNRFCTFSNHQQFQVNQICTYADCDMTRWCCSECISNGIHGHLLPNQNHLMSQQNLLAKVKQDIEKLQKDYANSLQANKIKNFLLQLLNESQQLEYYIIEFRKKVDRTPFKSISYELFKEFLKLEQLIIEFINDVERQFINLISDSDSLKLQSLIKEVEGESFIQLDEDGINKLLNINKYQFKHNLRQQFKGPLNKILQQLNLLKNNYFIRKYVIKEIYEGDDLRSYKSSLISNNEKFLVYNKSNVLHIYDIKLNKICKKIKNKLTLTTFQFTSDSKCLFAGGYIGFVYGFLVQNNFKFFYKQQIHTSLITQIITYKQYLITSGIDRIIMKTDFLNKWHIFKFVENSSIICIDYFHQRNMIISSSSDMTIKIWSCSYQRIVIEQKCSPQMKQLSLINNSQHILCLDYYGHLHKLEIDLCNNKLVDKDYSQFNKYRIYRFQQTNNGQNLLLICHNDCLIFNHRNELIKKIDHNLKLKGNYLLNYKNLFYQIVFSCLIFKLDNQIIQIILFYIIQMVNIITLMRFENPFSAS